MEQLGFGTPIRFGTHLGPSWGYVGPSWGHVGPSWGPHWAIWGYVGPSCAASSGALKDGPGLPARVLVLNVAF